MWIGNAHYETLVEAIADGRRTHAELGAAVGRVVSLELENANLRAEREWFKHRLNQVEHERGQLIQAAIGVKIAVPEFVPTFEDPGQALNQLPDLSSIGDDAVDEGRPVATDADQGVVDYTLMPGYRNKR